nr:protein TIC 21, chloroplastic [Tanacetum cinerariifolium]
MHTLLLPSTRTGITPQSPSLTVAKPSPSHLHQPPSTVTFLRSATSSTHQQLSFTSSSPLFSLHSHHCHIINPNKLTSSPLTESYASRNDSIYSEHTQIVYIAPRIVILSFSKVVTGNISSPVTFCATAIGIAAAFLSTFWSYGYIRLSVGLRKAVNDPSKAPPLSNVIQSLKNGICLNILGMGAAIIGMLATVGMLVAKALTVSGNPYYRSGGSPVLALDIFLVQTFEPVEDGSVLYMGDEHFAPVHGKGSVALEFSSGKTITLFNVLYVPKLRVLHETTAPYTPQQNGVAERKNRALKEMVNSMLSYSGSSEGLWGEAMLTTCYLLNRVPNKMNKTTPY